MKLSSQTIVLSVALAAAAVTTAGVNASSRDLTRNRKTTTRERRIRNLFQVESATTTLEEIVQINDAELVRELMGHTMSMSMPSMPSGDSEDGGSGSSGSDSGTDAGDGSSGGDSEDGGSGSDSSSGGDSDSSGSGDETTPAETPSTDMTPGESPTAVGEPTASGTSGSTPLEAPTVGEPDFIAPTSGETQAETSSASRQNVAIAATITIAFMVVPFIL